MAKTTNSEKCDSCDEEKWEKFFKEKFGNWGKSEKWHHRSGGFMGGGFYGLGFLAAAYYYIQNADGFWMGVLGVLKALVWPAMLIYKVFTMLNM